MGGGGVGWSRRETLPESSRRRKWIFIIKWMNGIIKLYCITREERIGNSVCGCSAFAVSQT